MHKYLLSPKKVKKSFKNLNVNLYSSFVFSFSYIFWCFGILGPCWHWRGSPVQSDLLSRDKKVAFIPQQSPLSGVYTRGHHPPALMNTGPSTRQRRAAYRLQSPGRLIKSASSESAYPLCLGFPEEITTKAVACVFSLLPLSPHRPWWPLMFLWGHMLPSLGIYE